ncbi:MAG: hypothetical protein WD993_00125 [Thermoleophilaceae bacterium]
MEAATLIWLFVVLKVPVVAALLLIWWAVRDPGPATGGQDADDDDGGTRRLDVPHPRRPWPRRRGPHGGAQPPAPPRTRKPARARPIRTSR